MNIPIVAHVELSWIADPNAAVRISFIMPGMRFMIDNGQPDENGVVWDGVILDADRIGPPPFQAKGSAKLFYSNTEDAPHYSWHIGRVFTLYRPNAYVVRGIVTGQSHNVEVDAVSLNRIFQQGL